MTNGDRAAILAEIVALMERPEPGPDEVTVGEVAASAGITKAAARSRLDGAVGRGELTSRIVYVENRKTRAYKRRLQ